MNKTYCIKLGERDLGQLLAGLETRAEAWEKTANYHRTGELPPDFIVDECTDAHEADDIASHYRAIIATIEKQRGAQS